MVRSRTTSLPLMIGARRLAFPAHRVPDVFWILMAAGRILTTTIFFGGFRPAGRASEPLNDQANTGMDSYIVFFAARRPLDVPPRSEHDRDHPDDARRGADVVAPADLLLGNACSRPRCSNCTPRSVLIAVLGLAMLDRICADRLLHFERAAAVRTLCQNLFWVFGSPRSLPSSPARLRGRARDCCPSSRASRCGATASRSAACSA